MTGLLIVIEGPNGVGKTTLAEALARDLAADGQQPVHATTQPSGTDLGRYLRASEGALQGRALALALAADRYHQLTSEIEPELAAGHHVVIDRYVHSSLVLQRIDGLSLEEIWTYNQYVLMPDVTICLDADPEVITHRLDQRGRRSRLEAAGTPQLESTYYAEACAFLTQRGWHHHMIDTRDLTPDEVLASSLQFIH